MCERARKGPPSSTSTGRHTRRPGTPAAGRSGAGYDDVEGGGYLGVQPDRHLVRADGLDRVLDLDPAPVELGPARGLHGGGDVGGRHGPEEPAAAARTCLQPHVKRRKPARGLPGVVETPDLAGGPGPLDQLDLL